jgi:hypothetical protein
MYSPLGKFVMLGAGVFFLTVAGTVARTDNLGAAIGFLATGALAIFLFDRECQAQGAQPLTSLKPGRTYRVEGVLPDILNARGEKVARLVVSWHVDYGHFEFRIAHLPHLFFHQQPEVGDELDVQAQHGGNVYVLKRPVSATGNWS